MPMNEHKSKNKAGFTLIETLIVLAVVCSFVLLPTLAINKWQQRLEKVFFYYHFEKSSLHIQQVAIADQHSTRIDLYKDSRLIVFFTNHTELPWRKLEVPAEIRLQSGDSILFKAGTGNISTTQPESGSIPQVVFFDDGKKITYQYQLGSGRFEKK